MTAPNPLSFASWFLKMRVLARTSTGRTETLAQAPAPSAPADEDDDLPDRGGGLNSCVNVGVGVGLTLCSHAVVVLFKVRKIDGNHLNASSKDAREDEPVVSRNGDVHQQVRVKTLCVDLGDYVTAGGRGGRRRADTAGEVGE